MPTEKIVARQRKIAAWFVEPFLRLNLATTAQQFGREFLEELTTAIPLMQLVPAG